MGGKAVEAEAKRVAEAEKEAKAKAEAESEAKRIAVSAEKEAKGGVIGITARRMASASSRASCACRSLRASARTLHHQL